MKLAHVVDIFPGLWFSLLRLWELQSHPSSARHAVAKATSNTVKARADRAISFV